MKLFYTDHFDLPLPDGHRFPMAKYRRLRQSVVDNPLHERDIMLVPSAATPEQLCLAHDRQYVHRVLAGKLTDAEIKRIGFPWSERMVERSRRSSGATLAAARVALREGVSANLAGGTHHAMRATGEGYCVFNDAAVAIRTLIREQAIRNAAVVDCDVHQGNGTADILGSDPNVFTFSIHGEKNFPLRKMPSNLDIDLPDGTGDEDYLSALATGLQTTLAAGPYDLVIYLAGADPYEGDRLGRLNLTKEGLRRRDALVLETLRSLQTPVAIAMAGGYAPNIQDIVDIHSATLLIASQMQRDWSTQMNPSTNL
ncbi:MAG: histone deacetylase [Planctomycetota bacterium]|nr:histone deacetylase [Planctomycetota bacterium]